MDFSQRVSWARISKMVSFTRLKVGACCWLGALVLHVASHLLVDEIGFLTGQCQGGCKRAKAARPLKDQSQKSHKVTFNVFIVTKMQCMLTNVC